MTIATPAVDTGLNTETRVPCADHYRSRYLGADAVRLLSYRQQLFYALRHPVRTILVIGKGDGLVAELLRDYGVRVTTLDIAADLQPDLLGSVTAIPADNSTFDCALCCQVLEHLPFERFPVALRELHRVTRRRLVLSLPDIRRFLSWRIVAPKVSFCCQLSVPRWPAPVLPRERLERHGHYWEIGYRGSSFGDVRTQIRTAGWRVREVQRVHDLPWHTFFDCAAH